MGLGRRWLVGASALLLVGCGQTGSATTRIDEAEDEIVMLADELVDLLGLEVAVDRPLGARRGCDLVTGARGASNSLARRGPLPQIDDPVGRAGAHLDAAGYELVAGGGRDEVFGRRDGIRITVFADRATGQLAIDAATACRPL